MSASSFRLSLTIAATALAALSGCQKKDASRYTKDGLFIIRQETPTGYSENQIADSLGLWQKEGIKMEYVGVLTPGTSVPAALSGKIDVVGGHPNTIIKARLAGAKITAVVNGMVDNKDNPHIVYHVQKKSGITGIEGFRELAKVRKIKVAVSGRNGCSDWYFSEWLVRGGVPEDAVDWQIMPAKQQIEALSKGLVDVITTHPPFIGVADADPNFHRVLSSFDILGDPAAGASVRGFTDKFIKKYPDQVAAFVRVYVKAHKWSNAHQDSARILFSKIFKQPSENVSVFQFNAREWINDSDINPWIERQIAHKDIRPGIKVKASDIYTNGYNSYWEKAGKPNTVFPLPDSKSAQTPGKTTSLVERAIGQKTSPLRTAGR